MNRVVKTVVGFVGWIGLGAVLWLWAVPGEEQKKDKLMKELKPMPDQQRNIQDKKAMMVAILKEAAETNENVAAKPWPWKK